MVKILLILLLLTSVAHAEPITPVWEWPLSENVSMSTISLTNADGWVTANTSALQGRKEITILNTSSSGNLYISGITGSTSYATLYPRQNVTFRLSSELSLYVSSNTSLTYELIEIK